MQTVQLLAPYLPAEGRTVSPYSEGGALYALGIIHAGHGHAITEFLSTSLRNSTHEVVQHGACLGLGLSAQGVDDDATYDNLKGACPSHRPAPRTLRGYRAPACPQIALARHLACKRQARPSRSDQSGSLPLDLACMPVRRCREGVRCAADVLLTDSAVAGEAAAMAMGLLCCGAKEASAGERAAEMLEYAHQTAHEKIIRGLAVGLAMASYGREENADGLIEQLSSDQARLGGFLTPSLFIRSLLRRQVAHACVRWQVQPGARVQDPILRFGGMFALGMAYRGTDNNAAIQKLLHFAVSDVSDDVRRAAVMNLGFVLLGVPEQCPQIVRLLAESYNPHLRYGAALAVGIACAGSGAPPSRASSVVVLPLAL